MPEIPPPSQTEWTSARLREALHLRYHSGFACFDEIHGWTGTRKSEGSHRPCSRVDFMAVGIWATRGLIRRAFEIKISRSDFTREMRNREKNRWARDYCHEFWFMVPPGILKAEDMRDGDGLVVPGESPNIHKPSTYLEVIKPATRNKDPKLDAAFFASLCVAAERWARGIR